MKFSTGNKLVCSTYREDRSAMRAKVSSGFATIEQKNTFYALTLLVTAHAADGRHIASAGSKVYVKESDLMKSPAFKETFEAEGLSEPFLLVDISHVAFIDNETANP